MERWGFAASDEWGHISLIPHGISRRPLIISDSWGATSKRWGARAGQGRRRTTGSYLKRGRACEVFVRTVVEVRGYSPGRPPSYPQGFQVRPSTRLFKTHFFTGLFELISRGRGVPYDHLLKSKSCNTNGGQWRLEKGKELKGLEKHQ
eukprot:765128-Hanusia_phi.AAC.3